MLECEARYWLRRGTTTPEKVAELEESLAKKRGAAAVERLVEEMRRQWGRRREWLGDQHG
jgi:tRNA U54 and U55 pseudouridine synthase Pus10